MNVRRETLIPLGLLCAVTTWLAAPAAEKKEDKDKPKGGVRATLELNQSYYYAGDPLPVRVSVGNDGTAPSSNPVKTPLVKGFVVRAAGATVRPTGTVTAQEPARPDKLASHAFFGTVIDLTELYPEL